MTQSIFICYRHTDAGHAISLYRYLRDSFGSREIFFYTETVDIGVTFPCSISKSLNSARVIIIIIGPEWLTKLIEKENDPGIDYVYEEVRVALQRLHSSNAPLVIPVLVDGVEMPDRTNIDGRIGELVDQLSEIQHHHILGTQAEVDRQYQVLEKRITSFAQISSDYSHLDQKTPTAWYVPYSRNIHFCGRESELTLISETFSKNQNCKIVALVGLGGVGKSQLALEYVFRFSKEYTGVWWFRAEKSETFLVDIRLLYKSLGFEVK